MELFGRSSMQGVRNLTPVAISPRTTPLSCDSDSEKPKDPEEEVSHLLEGQSGSYELVSQVIEVQGSGGGTASGQTASCDRHQIVPEPSQAALLACIQQRSRAPSSCSSSFHARMHTNNRM